VVTTVGDGASAVAQALALRPDVLFLDIRMPGQNGLDAAAQLAEEWPDDAPMPALVFVTAYDAYAVQAFDAQAVDYLLKPVTSERLARAVQRAQQRLAEQLPAPQQLDQTLEQLRALLSSPSPTAPRERLSVIQASVGNSIRLLPVDEVLVFEAADKYLRVLTATQELLIRTPLRELLEQLDPAEFWQIHRSTVVRATAIESATRDETGKLFLRLRGRAENWPVSRLYAVRFRAM
jgi:DNA-binding LytR/AlgR family response regulator